MRAAATSIELTRNPSTVAVRGMASTVKPAAQKGSSAVVREGPVNQLGVAAVAVPPIEAVELIVQGATY